ncbi:hypothetical protein [Legionella tunisiensis]|uniref:hypothetical protein n=1 Tax=Legionella tunisiensis TaxID=1034944 RepID=UPI00031191BE|nr:hypothetical protein [Legionella tunisiensis]
MQPGDALTAEDYSKAMNLLGQNLLSALTQSIEKLPQPLRNRKVVSQALSAFLANLIYKQFPEDQESRQQMLDELTTLIQVQLDGISQFSESV